MGFHYLEDWLLLVGGDHEGESEKTGRKRYTSHC